MKRILFVAVTFYSITGYTANQEVEGFGDIADIVDLGLSVKWASWNVGAKSPEGLGDLYAWGELTPKNDYSLSTYKFYNNSYTKYGRVDNKYHLEPEDDVAQQLWGGKWRMPTYAELEELKVKCIFTKTEINGVPVTKVEGPNGNFIYFPYPGNYTGKTLYYKNSIGSYWSCDLESDSYAKDLDFISGKPSLNDDSRCHGQAIRPVYIEAFEESQIDDKFGKVADVVDLGLSVKWASWNVGASKIADYGGLYGAGDPTGLKTSTSYNDYHWADGENICGTENDLAHVKWGDKWQLPTIEQLKELKEKCTWKHNVTIDNVKGSLATGPNGKTLFFPYAGARVGNSNSYFNKHASIWSGETGYAGSTYYSYSYKDIDINFSQSATVRLDGCDCYYGQSIRPVYIERLNDDSNYKSMNDYINESVISVINNDGDYSISPVIRNIKKIYVDLTKGSTNSLYCYLGICNNKDTREISFSSKYLNSISTDNFIIDNKRYGIKDLVDKKTFSWLYYNPNNTNEVIIDVKEYFGQVGYIYKWQKNFGTSCIVNIETDDFETSEDYISVSSSKTSSGEEFSIEINLENSITDYTAYQFDIVLPAGISVATNANGKYVVTKTDRYEDEAQSLNISALGDNAYRIVSFSMSNGKITGRNGSILNAVLTTDKNVKSGSYEGVISNIIFTKSDGTQVRLKDAKITIVVDNPVVGDTNGDKEVNVSDIVEVVNFIMNNPSAKFVKANADLNGDGEVNVTDIVMMVNIIMSAQTSLARTMSNRARSMTGGDCLTIDDVTINAGEMKQVSISLNNPDKKYTAFQFDLTLPEGITIAKNSNGKLMASLDTERKDDHTLSVSQLENNTYRFLTFSMSNAELYGTSGALVNITLEADANMESGTNSATLKSQVFTATDGTQYKWSDKSFSIQINENTGVDEISKNGQKEGRVKVYTLTGLLLFSVPQSESSEKWRFLPSGVYIVNGQKMIKSDDSK